MARKCPKCSEEMHSPDLDGENFRCEQCGAEWIIIAKD